MPTRLEIITAESVLFEGDVCSIAGPGAEGELGVLPNHASVMTSLRAGELRYRVGNEQTHFVIHGGFMDSQGDHVETCAIKLFPVPDSPETSTGKSAFISRATNL